MIYFIDSSTFISLLKGDIGYTQAKETLVILTGRAQALAALPPILAIAMSAAFLPAVAPARLTSMSLRLTLLSGAPLALYLTAGAFPVNGLLLAIRKAPGFSLPLASAASFIS